MGKPFKAFLMVDAHPKIPSKALRYRAGHRRSFQASHGMISIGEKLLDFSMARVRPFSDLDCNPALALGLWQAMVC